MILWLLCQSQAYRGVTATHDDRVLIGAHSCKRPRLFRNATRVCSFALCCVHSDALLLVKQTGPERQQRCQPCSMSSRRKHSGLHLGHICYVLRSGQDAHILAGGHGCVLLELKGDEEADREVALAQGTLSGMDQREHRTCHGYLGVPLILARDVVKETLQAHTYV